MIDLNRLAIDDTARDGANTVTRIAVCSYLVSGVLVTARNSVPLAHARVYRALGYNVPDPCCKCGKAREISSYCRECFSLIRKDIDTSYRDRKNPYRSRRKRAA